MTEILPARRDEGLTYTAREPDQLERSLDRIDDVVRFAEIIAPTHFVPAGLRGKPDQILACIMLGRELGLGPMRSLSWVALVDGHPTVYAEGQRAIILARGHEIRLVEWTKTRCVLAGRRAGASEWTEVAFTMDDAQTAGLKGKPSWRQYPMEMLLARATSRLARLLFADVLAGLGTTEDYADLNGSEASGANLPPSAPEGEATVSPKTTRRRRRAISPDPEAAAASNSESLPETPEDVPSETARLDSILGEVHEAEGLAREKELIRDLEASGAQLVDEATEAAEAPELITDEQRTKLHAAFGEKGVTTREAKLAYVSTVAGREIASSNDLTVAEASAAIDALEQWHPEDPASRPFPPGIGPIPPEIDAIPY